MPPALFFSILSGVENVFVQPVERFLHAGERQSEIHANVAGTVELPAVLHRDADVPARLFQLVDGLAVRLAPLHSAGRSRPRRTQYTIGTSP